MLCYFILCLQRQMEGKWNDIRKNGLYWCGMRGEPVTASSLYVGVAFCTLSGLLLPSGFNELDGVYFHLLRQGKQMLSQNSSRRRTSVSCSLPNSLRHVFIYVEPGEFSSREFVDSIGGTSALPKSICVAFTTAMVESLVVVLEVVLCMWLSVRDKWCLDLP